MMHFILSAGLSAVVLGTAAAATAPPVFTFDAHIHVINRQFYHGGDIGDRVTDGQFDLPRAKEGGLNALFFSLFVDGGVLSAAL